VNGPFNMSLPGFQPIGLPGNAHLTFCHTTERLHCMLQLLWWSNDWLPSRVAIVHLNCVKQPVQKATQLLIVVLQAGEGCIIVLHHCLIPAKQEACMSSNKQSQSLFMLNDCATKSCTEATCAKQPCKVPVTWISNRLSTRVEDGFPSLL